MKGSNPPTPAISRKSLILKFRTNERERERIIILPNGFHLVLIFNLHSFLPYLIFYPSNRNIPPRWKFSNHILGTIDDILIYEKIKQQKKKWGWNLGKRKEERRKEERENPCRNAPLDFERWIIQRRGVVTLTRDGRVEDFRIWSGNRWRLLESIGIDLHWSRPYSSMTKNNSLKRIAWKFCSGENYARLPIFQLMFTEIGIFLFLQFRFGSIIIISCLI